jgi:hypothetical protein
MGNASRVDDVAVSMNAAIKIAAGREANGTAPV